MRSKFRNGYKKMQIINLNPYQQFEVFDFELQKEIYSLLERNLLKTKWKTIFFLFGFGYLYKKLKVEIDTFNSTKMIISSNSVLKLRQQINREAFQNYFFAVLYQLLNLNNMLANLPLDEHVIQKEPGQKDEGISILQELILQINKLSNFLPVQHLQDSVTFKKQVDLSSKNQGSKLLIITKRQNFIEIRCSSQINKRMSKCLKNFLLAEFQKINTDNQVQLLGIKAYYNSTDNNIVLESHIKYINFLNPKQRIEVLVRFEKIISQSFKLLSELQTNFQNHLAQTQTKLKYELVKYREAFEQNRIQREKSTKICLLSKNKSHIVNKIVMNYLDDIRRSTLVSRELYSKYRQKKSQMSKQQNQGPKKLKFVWEKRKNQQSQDDRNDKTKMSSPFIVQPIAILSQDRKEEMQHGGFGSVSKYKCSFKELYTFYHQSQLLIQKTQDQNKTKEQEKFIKIQNLVKKLPLNNEYANLSFQNELQCLNSLRHEKCSQIAQYYHPVIKVKEEKIINETFVQSKYLYSKFYEIDFKSFQHSSYKTKIKIIQDLAEGIKFFVESGVVHRDLKPSNIKLTKTKNVKIIDFGSACFEYSRMLKNSPNKKRRMFCFSPDYTLEYAKASLNHFAEEQYYRHKYYDLYAFGIITRDYFGLNQGDPAYLIESLEYLWGKCMEFNPEDRIEPIQVLVYLRELLKLISIS